MVFIRWRRLTIFCLFMWNFFKWGVYLREVFIQIIMVVKLNSTLGIIHIWILLYATDEHAFCNLPAMSTRMHEKTLLYDFHYHPCFFYHLSCLTCSFKNSAPKENANWIFPSKERSPDLLSENYFILILMALVIQIS